MKQKRRPPQVPKPFDSPNGEVDLSAGVECALKLLGQPHSVIREHLGEPLSYSEHDGVKTVNYFSDGHRVVAVYDVSGGLLSVEQL